MTINRIRAVLCLSTALFSCNLMAATEKEMVAKAQEKLGATLTGWNASYFGESPIEGMFEVHTGTKVIYWHAESEIMIFGKMFNAAGEDLTQKSLNAQAKNKIKSLPMDSAIRVQKGKIKLIEIVNPDCSYCKKYDAWIEQASKIYSVERNVIFLDTPNFPEATAKIKAVICAKDQGKAYKNLSKEKFELNASCKNLNETLENHTQIIEALGVNGTPSFIKDDGSLIVGYNPAELEEYFIKKTKEL